MMGVTPVKDLLSLWNLYKHLPRYQHLYDLVRIPRSIDCPCLCIQATIRHCDVFGRIGDYTGEWFNGCMGVNGGTANSVELCAKQLATKLSGVTVRRE